MPKSIQVNIRVPAELYARLEKSRGSVERSTYILAALEHHLADPAKALADVLALAAARGLSPAQLAALLPRR